MVEKVALFDMGGTIADYLGKIQTDLIEIGNEPFPEKLHGELLPNWLQNRINLIKSRNGWWETLPLIESGNGLHYGRVFVDDWSPFMEAWLEHRPRGLGLMPVGPENEGFSHPQVIKYNPINWRTNELEERLREAYDRK